MKIEQQVGSDAPTQNAYVGEARQLTVDTDNWDLRLHDGVTPGGHLLINRDNGDERWQAKSAELDGIDFTAEKRGFLTRLGTGIWRIRQWEWDANAFVINNPAGYGGNPEIILNDTIVGDRVLDGNVEVTGDMQVDGILYANLEGTTTGTHTGPVIGNVMGDVTGDLTGDSYGNHTGGVDTRGATLIMDNGQIDPAWIDDLDGYIFARAVPFGCILIWSGSEGAVPNGYEICNGLNGTPDLRDKFVIGAGSLDFVVGQTGGALTHSHATAVVAGAGTHSHTLVIEDHILTESQIPSHKHGSGVTDNHTDYIFNHGYLAASPNTSSSIEGNSADGNYEGYTTDVGGGLGHNHDGTASGDGIHTHDLNNPSSSSLPPYYSLCYIMRVA